MSQVPLIDGAMLRASRKRLGWKQSEVARRSGVSQSIISRLEGEQPPYDLKISNLLLIAKTLMVPLDSLIKVEVRPGHVLPSYDLEPTLAGIVSLIAEMSYMNQQRAALILEGFLNSIIYQDDDEDKFSDPNVSVSGAK